MCGKFFTLSHLARHATAGLRPVLLEGCHPCIRELFSYASANASAKFGADVQQITFFSKICFPLIKHPSRVRHATEDDLSSDEWHLYTQL